MEKDIWIYAHWNTYSSTTEYQVRAYEHSQNSGDVLVEHRIISFEEFKDDFARGQLANALRAKLSAMRITHLQEQTELQEVIKTLLSIEYKPA